MAKTKRSHIALLFLGGSVIDPRGRRGDQVMKLSDVEPWMAQMGETEIIADTEGFFVASGQGPIGLGEWAAAAKMVGEKYSTFDGFVLIHDLPTLPAAAIVLSKMLEGLEKPVVLVGSPLRRKGERRGSAPATASQPFGAKASIINAVQVAASDIAEVAVVFGSTILRGRSVTFSTDPTLTIAGTILGRVDFGIRLFGEQVRRASRTLHVQPKFETNVAVVELVPGLDIKHLLQQTTHHQAVFVAAAEGFGVSTKLITSLAKRLGTLPLAVYSREHVTSSSLNVISLADASRTSALLRFMWALGQSHDVKRLRKLLPERETD